MKAYLVIVFTLGQSVSSVSIPMETVGGCVVMSKEIQQTPATTPPDQVVVHGVIIQSFCVEQR